MSYSSKDAMTDLQSAVEEAQHIEDCYERAEKLGRIAGVVKNLGYDEWAGELRSIAQSGIRDQDDEDFAFDRMNDDYTPEASTGNVY